MFGSAVLEIAIGLAFVYLLFSLVCTTLAEWIARILRLRASTLKGAIKNMFSSKVLENEFYEHSLVKSLSKSSLFDSMLKPVSERIYFAKLKEVKWLQALAIIVLWGFFFVFLFNWFSEKVKLPQSILWEVGIGVIAVIFTILQFRLNKASPSYIPPHTFTQVLLNMFEENEEEFQSDDIDSIVNGLRKTPPSLEGSLKNELHIFEDSDKLRVESNRSQGPWIVDHSEWPYAYRIDCDARNNICKIKRINQRLIKKKLGDNTQNRPPLMHTLQTLYARANVEANNTAYDKSKPVDDAVIQASYQKQIEKWFQDAQDRVNGWYTRKMGVIVFLLACVVTVVFNLDTFAIVNALSRDAELREEITEQAQLLGTENPEIAASLFPTNTIIVSEVLGQLDDEIKMLGLPIGWVTVITPTAEITPTIAIPMPTVITVTTVISATGPATREATSAATIGDKSVSAIPKIHDKISPGVLTMTAAFTTFFTTTSLMTTTNEITGTNEMFNSMAVSPTPVSIFGPPFITEIASGTKAHEIAETDGRIWPRNDWSQWAKKLPGFLLTIFALALGAPFWFDTLNKFVDLRSSGNQPTADADNNQSQNDA